MTTVEIHWGMPFPAPTLCGGDGPRRTTTRLVNCQFCCNRIDLWLHEHPPAAIALASKTEGGTNG